MLREEILPRGERINHDRQFFVNRELAATVIDGLPNTGYKLAFAMMRFMGMRRCEVMTVRWADVDWKNSRLTINSPKTGRRVCPIFAEVLPLLKQQYQERSGEDRIINEFRTTEGMTPLFIKHINRILASAGLRSCTSCVQAAVQSFRRRCHRMLSMHGWVTTARRPKTITCKLHRSTGTERKVLGLQKVPAILPTLNTNRSILMKIALTTKTAKSQGNRRQRV